MQPPDTLLLAALRAAPRRHCLPPLPGDAAAARACGPETALASAIEATRRAEALPQARDLFTWALAALIGTAMDPGAGDPAFQALVLQAQDAAVDEYAALAAGLDADRRAVRAAVDAVAHPGKLRAVPEGSRREALAQLHLLATAGAWSELAAALEWALTGELAAAPAVRGRLEALLAGPPLQRLRRAAALARLEAVQRYRALLARQGPPADSASAARAGRASARLGAAAEQETLQAFAEIAALLEAAGRAPCRPVGGLRAPPGFPGAAHGAKDEWDAALLTAGDAAAGPGIVLLAEVKASPAAAGADLPRLLRGLRRLAHATAGAAYAFASAQGPVMLPGETLRRLRPPGDALPPHVIYCCSAPPEARPQLLGAASKAMLLAQGPSLAFARALAARTAPAPAALLPVWEDLARAPRLRPVLHQYQTATLAREAMLHPRDLVQAVRDTLAVRG